MPIPLHPTLDDWSGNVSDVKHIYINRIALEGTRYAHPYAQELSERCGYHFHGTQNRQRGRGSNTRQPVVVSFHVTGPACDLARWAGTVDLLSLSLTSYL